MRTGYCFLLLLSLAIVFYPTPCHGQFWSTQLLTANSAQETVAASDHQDGRTVVTGSARLPNGRHEMLTACLDHLGDTLWTRRISHTHDTRGTHVLFLPGGDVVTAGAFWSGTGWTPFVQKYLANGTVDWRKDHLPPEGYSLYPRDLEMLADGSTIMLAEQFNGVERHSVIIAVSNTGTGWWSRSETYAVLNELHIHADEITAVGSIVSGNSDHDMFAIRLTRSGALLNSVSLDASEDRDDRLTHVTADDDRIYAAGVIPVKTGSVRLVLLRWDGTTTPTQHTVYDEQYVHRYRGIQMLPGVGVALLVRRELPAGGMGAVIHVHGTDGQPIRAMGMNGNTNTDTHAPIFGGCSGATALSSDSVLVSWAPARDGVYDRDQLTYSIYAATTSGGQNFSTPDLTVTGTQATVLAGLTPGTEYYIVVRCEDPMGNRDTNTREIHVTTGGQQLLISTEALPAALVCQPYQFALQAAGGRAPYSWSILTGAFPAGFTLEANGTLSGETTTPGSYTFTVGVEDADALTATKELTFIIDAAPRLHVTTDMSLPAGTHCYSSIIVEPAVTLTLQGDAVLRCSDTLYVIGRILAPCSELSIIDYSYARIRGIIDNRCATGDTTDGPSILFYSHRGDFSLEMESTASGVFSHGGFHLTDDTTIAEWETVVTPDARSTVPLDPVANITADVLNDIMAPDETIEVLFTCEGADPDGGPVSFDIDFGDGDVRSGLQPDDGAVLEITKQYAAPGTYLVNLTVEDNEQRSSGASVQVHVGDSLSDGSGGLGASITAGYLLHRDADSLYFRLGDGSGPATALSTVLWDFGDGNSSAEQNPAYMYAAPGRYPVTCTVMDDSGNTAMVQQSLYIYTPDTNAVRAAPPGKETGISAQTLQNRVASVDAPVFVNRRIVFRGFQHLWVGNNADVFTRNGRDGRPGGVSGQSGRGLSAYSPGWLVVNGGRLRAGNGGHGATNTPKGSHGSRGGKGGSINVSGRNVWIGGGATISGGDGGEGGDVSVSAPAPGTARAFAKKGGDAAGRVRIRATNSVNFGGPVTIHTGNGGRGGNATATGGAGQSKCTTGQEGAKALARAGRGGKANKSGTITGNVSGMNNVTLTGGQGGNGGTASAKGGRGGNATCENLAIGGQGGWARAFGGDGGKSGYRGPAVTGSDQFKPGAGGDGIATPGDGGNGTATPNPAKGQDGCPGENGGDAVAFGGDGGDGLAVTGKKGRLVGSGQDADAGEATVNGSDGGVGTATGGDGGNGTHCDCDGGNGGKAEAYGGNRGKTEARGKDGGTETINEGKDGSSSALGGNGGNGGHCCTPPAPVGGDGGNGGDADAWAGPNGGVGDAMGGNGGNGGDGKGPGIGGIGGTATSHAPSGLEIDGPDGDDGEWCFLVDQWYIYFSTISDGTIAPGSDLQLGTYTDKNLATQIGTVMVHFMTDQELGMPLPPSYFKSGPQLFIEIGGLAFDMTTLSDIIDPSRSWYDNEFSIRFQTQGTTPGMMTILGYENNQVIAQKEVFLDPAVGTYQEGIAAPQGKNLDRVEVVTDSPVSFDHWEVEIIVVDP